MNSKHGALKSHIVPEQEILEEAGLSSCGVWSRQQGEEFAGVGVVSVG